MHETTRLLRDLVAIPSVNPMGRPLRGPTSSSTASPPTSKTFFRGLGVRYERQTVAPLRDNIVACHEPPAPTRTLVFEVHQDTVPTDHMTIDPFGAAHRERPALRPRRLRHQGRHGGDAGGVRPAGAREAGAVGQRRHGLHRGRGAHLPRRAAAGQGRPARRRERSGRGRRRRADRLDIVHAHKGVVRWHLHTAGRSCHSSAAGAGRQRHLPHGAGCCRWSSSTPRSCGQARSHPLLGPADAERRPDRGRHQRQHRARPLPRSRSTAASIPGEDAGGRAGGAAGVPAAARAGGTSRSASREPWLSCPALGPEGRRTGRRGWARRSTRCAAAHQVHAVPYGTDASTLAEAGMPSVVFGPGDIAQAHTCDEWIDAGRGGAGERDPVPAGEQSLTTD